MSKKIGQYRCPLCGYRCSTSKIAIENHQKVCKGIADVPVKEAVSIKDLPEVKTLDGEINGLVHGTRVYSPKVLQNYFWKAIEAIQKAVHPSSHSGEQDVKI